MKHTVQTTGVDRVLISDPDFDIQKIADSGQCFRLNRSGNGEYTLIAHDRLLRLRQTPYGCEADCGEEAFRRDWYGYFDLGRDYAAIRARVDPGDAYLSRAAEFGRGIRILRQDPWETLVSFIVSQRKTIPAIKFCVEALCARYGDPLPFEPSAYAFPRPETLAALGEEEFRACSLGYRAGYVLGAAKLCAGGALDLGALNALPDEALFRALLAAPGAGEKVVNCVMLFGYHRLARFPRDVWINRVLEREYGGATPPVVYGEDAGVLQQYLFYYERSAARAPRKRAGLPE